MKLLKIIITILLQLQNQDVISIFPQKREENQADRIFVDQQPHEKRNNYYKKIYECYDPYL